VNWGVQYSFLLEDLVPIVWQLKIFTWDDAESLGHTWLYNFRWNIVWQNASREQDKIPAYFTVE
jgi:hypothetical protein